MVRAAAPFELRGTTANVADPAGSYGLALSSLAEVEALGPGETGHALWLAQGADGAGSSRTNLAVTLLDPGSAVRVTVLDDAGVVLGEEEVRAAAPVFWQRPVAELVTNPSIPAGRAEVTVLSGRAVAYAASVDDVTGDGILALARPLPPGLASGPVSWLLPGAARTPGRNGTVWRTDLRLFNPSLDAVVATVVPVTGLPAAAPLVVRVAPRSIASVDDVLGPDGLRLPDGVAGALSISAPGPLLALARTRNLDPSGRPGSFSAYQEPIPSSGLLPAGASAAFRGLAGDGGTTGQRTNVAVVTGASGVTLHLVLKDLEGNVVASADASLAADAWEQRPLADWFGIAPVSSGASLEATVASGSATLYASVVDNGTGDAVVLAPERLPTAGCSPPSIVSFAASRPGVTAGESVTLAATVAGSGARLVVTPGDLVVPAGGTLTVVPAVTTTYRLAATLPCGAESVASATVTVAAPAGALLTSSGALRGVTDGGSVVYRGIPYAAPPTGALRFRPPAAGSPWSGVRDASSFGAVCPQLDDSGTAAGSEDCLFLNVWTPFVPPPSPLPILFFVHGGGNVQGSGSEPYYDGRTFAANARGVVVTANYRLGTLGWLALPELASETRRGVSGNYGSLDQLAALRWIRRNAAAFGGDPSRVLVFGESAGGVDACTLAASPLARGLFSSALVESGGCFQPSTQKVEAFGATVADALGCAGAADPAACLRGLPAGTVLERFPPAVSITSNSGQLFGPAVDGFLLDESPIDAFRNGHANAVAFAIGANADETGAAVPRGITSEADYQAAVRAQYGALLAPAILARYPASAYPSPRKALVAVTTDQRFVCPSRAVARAAAQGARGPVFRYFFRYPANRLYGAIHGIELPFVFGSLDGIPGYTPTPFERSLSDQMNRAWAFLAGSGDPNGPGAPAWPAYDPAADRTLVFDDPPAAADGIRTQTCDFWDALAQLGGASLAP